MKRPVGARADLSHTDLVLLDERVQRGIGQVTTQQGMHIHTSFHNKGTFPRGYLIT
jgi:hypothetical protein